ncbi:Beta-fructofuranosidase, insoluble isoenzyme CWINV1 [Linum perenne]
MAAIQHNSFVFVFACLLFISHQQLQASHHPHSTFLSSSSSSSSSRGQPYRTGYHFQPPKNWINGPMIHKGIYHLFYQYNPRGPVWGNIVWAHSTSTDLVNWKPQGYGIYPSQPYDMKGTWSGSTTLLHDGTPAILYTGINPKQEEVQNLAIPKNESDPYLREWVKSPKNPVITPRNGINASAFRDPSTAWANHPLHSTQGTGMWECPDFFPVLTGGNRIGIDTSKLGPNVKHVLKVSLDDTKHDHYMIGTYDPIKDVYTPERDGFAEKDFGLRYDYGKSGKQLIQWPVKEIEKLRGKAVKVESQVLKPGTRVEVSGITAVQADVELFFGKLDLSKAEILDTNWTNDDPQFSLEYSKLIISVFLEQNNTNDKMSYGTFVDVDDPAREYLSLRTLIDHSIVESFGGFGKSCITARV